MINPLTSVTAGMRSPVEKQDDPAETKGAAQQFEALLMGMLLKSAREAGGSGWLNTGDDDNSGELGLEVAEQQFAQMLAASGGFGLNNLIQSGLERATQQGADSASPPGLPE